jgi:hypothetical protein
MPSQLFVFIQLEFPWALGPADGRYLVRREIDNEPEHVVVLGTLAAGRQLAGAPGASIGGPPLLWRRKRTRPQPTGPEPAPVPTTRATVIDPVSLSAESQARAWLAELDREREVQAASAVVNRVIHAHRIAAADPHVHEISPAQALVIRAGWGEGEQVADGRWLHARALPWPTHARGAGGGRRPRRDRSWALRPQERLAALLGGRGKTLLCEEITLRARADLDAGRLAHAALELDRAHALAVRELRDEGRQDLAIRIGELEHLQPGVRAQAQAAQAGATDTTAASASAATGQTLDEDVLTHALERVEAALRARTATGV